ncbi:biotin/lipoyl-containing protein [Hydrogenophaga sp. PBL-H3]|uniref:biotin/lipoyl-containing protein n=1 Tax=Hydrogenophaga sp. PBL-H3 TaxID=434010 RepID=UPI00131FE603|nr:lipoyl domain-containing protein [Hydrogenophaga sp. PBL-H3]QHE76164.1 biotin attachment protein [Hydrogenophaga sp. PBL-H3]QHE80588.1 biotin attachment protein [Hydrogenophaga sp. PBL-H3]
MHEVTLDPHLWLTLEAGDQARLERWLVSEGDVVHAGELLAQARLVHQTVDIAAPHSGVLESIQVAAGERLAHGAVLARIIPL